MEPEESFTMFTRAHHRSLSWIRWIQSTPSRSN